MPFFVLRKGENLLRQKLSSYVGAPQTRESIASYLAKEEGPLPGRGVVLGGEREKREDGPNETHPISPPPNSGR